MLRTAVETAISGSTLLALHWRGPHRLKGPRKAVVGYKIAPKFFETTYRSVLTFDYSLVVFGGGPRPPRSFEGRSARTTHSLFPPSLISHLATVDVKQHVYFKVKQYIITLR